MKKISLVLALAVVSFTQSCRKCDRELKHPQPHVTNQTVNATIAENSSYTYTLPVLARPGISYITAAPAHAGSSTIAADANGNIAYQYTPAKNFTGTDVIIITTQDEKNSGGNPLSNYNPGAGQGGHHCSHQGGDNTIVTTINVTVSHAADVVAKPVAQQKAIDL